MTSIDRRLLRYFDWQLLAISFTVPLVSLIVLYSAGYDPDDSRQLFNWFPLTIQSTAFVKQLVFLGVGSLVMIVGSLIPPSFLHRLGLPLYGFGILLLIGVLGVGVVSHGARRWLSLGPITFQPSEMMKLGVILVLARYLSKNPPPSGGYNLRQLVIPFLIFIIPMALIMKQPDLGTALSLGGVGFVMVLFMGIRWQSLLTMVVAGAVAAYPAWSHLKPYQQRRVFALLDPEQDPLGSGYHIIQSKIAVGSGALFGKGFLQGTQSHLEFLPEHTTDFIFSVLAEEWGFIGCSLLIFLYALFIYRILRVVQRTRTLYSSLVVFGIGAIIFIHALINIGMVIGIFPVVGIPLPLVSYGGTSVLSTMFGLGIIMGFSMRRHVF